MQTTLLSLLAVSAGVLASPTQTRGLACEKMSESFAWYVTGFQYNATEIFTTPSHQNDDGEIAFHVSNTALMQNQSSTGCFARSSQIPDYFYGNIVYDCIDPRSSSYTNTTFAFNVPTGLLSVNQTWTCMDSGSPTTFYATGAVNMTLDCTDESYKNSNWTLGQTYSNTSKACTALDGPVFASSISAMA